jgi:hypothetical protein
MSDGPGPALAIGDLRFTPLIHVSVTVTDSDPSRITATGRGMTRMVTFTSTVTVAGN